MNHVSQFVWSRHPVEPSRAGDAHRIPRPQNAGGRSRQPSAPPRARLIAAPRAADRIANLFTWDRAHPPIDAADFDGDIAGLAYSAYGRWDSPITGKRIRRASQRSSRDMKVLSGTTRRIRTYIERIPGDRRTRREERPDAHRRRLARCAQGLRRSRDRRHRARRAQPYQHRTRDRRQRVDPACPAADRRDHRADPRGQAAHPQARVDCRTLACLAALPGACSQRRLHHRPPAALLGRPAGARGDRLFVRAPRTTAEALSEQEDRDRRNRLAESGRPPQRRVRDAGASGSIHPGVPGPCPSDEDRLLPDGVGRPTVEDRQRRPRRSVLGHPRRVSRAEVRVDRAGRIRPRLADQGGDRIAARRGADLRIPAPLSAPAACQPDRIRDRAAGGRRARRSGWSRFPSTTTCAPSTGSSSAC